MQKFKMWKVFIPLMAILVLVSMLAACAAPAPATVTKTAPAVTVTATVTPPPPKVIKWRGQSYFPTAVTPYGHFTQEQSGVFAGIREYGEWLENISGGILEITWADPGAIVPQADQDIAVGDGTLDIATGYAGVYAGRLPEANIETDLPFAFEDVFAEWDAFNNWGLGEILNEAYGERNILWFPYHTNSRIGLGTSFPVPNAAAVAGHNVRAAGARAKFVKLLDANPVPLAWGEMYQGMQLGTIDAWMSGPGTMEDIKLKEVTDYWVNDPYISPACSNFIINRDSFAELPEEVQDAILRDSKYILFGITNWYTLQSNWVLKIGASEYGIEQVAWPAEDIRMLANRSVTEIYPEVAALSPRCADMIDIVTERMKAYGRL